MCCYVAVHVIEPEVGGGGFPEGPVLELDAQRPARQRCAQLGVAVGGQLGVAVGGGAALPA